MVREVSAVSVGIVLGLSCSVLALPKYIAQLVTAHLPDSELCCSFPRRLFTHLLRASVNALSVILTPVNRHHLFLLRFLLVPQQSISNVRLLIWLDTTTGYLELRFPEYLQK